MNIDNEQSNTKRFLSSFRGETQTNIIEFGKRLWEQESDIFIFMARKAACFFEALRELKIADVRGLAVSDRILDMDTEFLKGKNVTLVDDCIFTGTSIYNARNAVMAAGAMSCNTISLSINRDWLRPNLLPESSESEDLSLAAPLILLDDAQSVQQCYDIVRAISVFPRPYDVDFPHTKNAKVSSEDLKAILEVPGWSAGEISTNYQRKHRVRVFTIIPDVANLDEIFYSVKGQKELVSIAKIRLYCRETSTDTWSIRLVPMAVLNAINESDIQPKAPLWENSEELLSELGFSSAKSRYRLLQYLLAKQILETFCQALMDIRNIHVSSEIREDLTEMTFGSRLYSHINVLLKHIKTAHLPTPAEEPPSQALAEFPSKPIEIDDYHSLGQECIAPFLWLYRELELPARALVKEHGLEYATKSKPTEIIRLGRGFSSKTLIGRLTSDSINIRRYVSLFLDQLIDQGIAVPTIVEDEKILYRAFRHGEDAVFGEAEERLCTQALRAYIEKREINEIYGLELQKFIVLFIQIALQQQDLIERLDTSQGIDVGCRVISIKGHLHGPVPTTFSLDKSGNVGTPYITGNDPFEWISQNWVKRGILTTPTANDHLFSNGDIKDSANLLKHILTDNSPQSAYIRDTIGFNQPTLDAEHIFNESQSDELLIPGINSILKNKFLASNKIFQAIKLRNITKNAVKRSYRSKDNVLANRLIIEDTYPQFFYHSRGGEKYYLGKLPSLAIGIRKEGTARRIGRTLGSLIGTGKKPLDNENDLILLSTCTDADYQVRALSGELAILKERWITSIDQVRELVRVRKYSTALDVLRDSNQLHTAVHSGCMKYKWFVENKLLEVLSRTKQYAESQDSTGSLLDDWQSLWPDGIHSFKLNVPPALNAHIHTLGYHLLLARLAIALLDLWIVGRAEEAHQKIRKNRKSSNAHNECLKYYAELNKLRKEHTEDSFNSLIEGKVFSDVISNKESLAKLCRQSTDLINSIRASAYSSLLSDSRVYTDRYGSIEELQAYPYALHFEASDPVTGDFCQLASRKILYKFCPSESKIIDSLHNPWRRGAWIILKGNVNSTKAVELLKQLIDHARLSNTKFRATLVGQLPYTDCIREMKNSEKHAEGNFFARISNLREFIQPNPQDGSITVISEDRESFKSEHLKFSELTKLQANEMSTAISSGCELAPLKVNLASFSALHSTTKSSIMKSPTTQISEFNELVKIGIITIREDEYDAVLRRIPRDFIVESESAYYSVCKISCEDGSVFNAAIVRCLEQGESAAQAVATNMIRDLSPDWIVAVGIGGSIPNSDSTLGDVLVSSRVHDLSVNALSQNGSTTYQDMGSPVTVPVEKLLSGLRAFSDRISNWNESTSIGISTPSIAPLGSIDDRRLYGDEAWRNRVKGNIEKFFPAGLALRQPIFAVTPVITTNSLIKDTKTASNMSSSARHASGVEMEIGGIMKAARYSNINVFAIRGISDVIGFERDSAWTSFACETAASFATALIRSGLIK
jgi:nucleoside phosphorylase